MAKSKEQDADGRPFLIVYEFDEDPLEQGQQQQQQREYSVIHDDDDDSSCRIQETTTSSSQRRRLLSSWSKKPAKLLAELFLPVGYPATVRDGYLEYQLYDSVQGLCSYLRGVLCSAAVLEAAGVGNAQATALAAALTWASRDGFAMTGGLLYSYCVADKFDAHVKEFRLFADLTNDAGFLLDMLAPWFAARHSSHHQSQSFLLMVSSAAVLCKTVCGISAGATKSSITQHFAVAGNMADLNARESTQETMVSLIGMVLGIYAAKIVQAYHDHDDNDNKEHRATGSSSGSSSVTAAYLNWTIFIVLTFVHIWANYRGVMLLRMRTLNRARAEAVLGGTVVHHTAAAAAASLVLLQQQQEGTKKGHHNSSSNIDMSAALLPELPEPGQVRESLLHSSLYIIFSRRLHLGVPLTTILEQDCNAALLSGDDDKYVLTVHSQTGHVLVSLLVGAANRDELKAYVHACAVLECMDQHVSKGEWKQCRRDWISSTHGLVSDLFRRGGGGGDDNDDDDDRLVSELRRKGWDVDGRLYLGFSRRRSRWIKPSTTTTTMQDKKDK